MNEKDLLEKLSPEAKAAYNELEIPEREYYQFKDCDNCSQALKKQEYNRAITMGFARVCKDCWKIVEAQLKELTESLAEI